MVKKILLCIDSESYKNPELIGLENDAFRDANYFQFCCDGLEARNYARTTNDLSEIWVISSDSVSGINLAAVLKRECVSAKICLITNEKTGSLYSRACAAGVDTIFSEAEFVRNFYAAASQNNSSESSEINNADSKSGVTASAVFRTPVLEVAEVKSGKGVNLSDSLDKESEDLIFDLEEALPLIQQKNEEKNRDEEPFEKTTLDAINSLQEFGSFDSAKKGSEKGYVVAYVSGSGGCGKSSLSVMSAMLSQAYGYKTLLLDADLQFGDAKYLLSKKDALDIFELMQNPEKIKVLEPHDGFPALLAAPKKLEQSEVIIVKFKELVDYLKSYFEVVIVNTGTFWSEEQTQLLEIADQSVFVIDQRPSSVRACAHALDLCSRCGIATQSFQYVLNFCSKRALLSSLDVSCALHGVEVHEIKDGGRDVAELLGAGLPNDLMREKNLFSESVLDYINTTLFSKRSPKQIIVPSFEKKSRWIRFSKKKRDVACL